MVWILTTNRSKKALSHEIKNEKLKCEENCGRERNQEYTNRILLTVC